MIFTIEADSLASHRSRRPKHLETRISQRLRQRTTSSDSEGSSAGDQLSFSSGSESNSHNAASSTGARHEAFLSARREKLATRMAHVAAVLSSQRRKESQSQLKKRQNIEETLDKAKMLRESRLEGKIEANAAHVRKAKDMARTRQQRIIEHQAQLAKALEGRLRHSATRRETLKSVPRARLLDPSSRAHQEALVVKDESAQHIQNWFRQKKFEPIAKIYRKIGLSRESASKLSFSQLTSRIQSNVVIKTASYVIIRAKRIVGKGDVAFKNPARVLLSCYMLHFFPKEALPTMDAQEEDLAHLADKLISDLDHWIGSSNAVVIAPLAKKFMATFTSYYEAFEAWKSRDTIKIIDELIGHFMELDSVWVKVFHNENAHEEWAASIEDHQAQHLKRIKKFGDSAVARLLHARQSFIAEILASDIEVTIAEVQDQTCPAYKLYLAPNMKVDSVAALPSSSTSSSVEKEQDMPSKEEMASFGDIFSNEQLAHELVMDPNFSLKPTKKTALEEQVGAMAKKAFADSVRKELNQEIYSKSVLGLLIEIRQALLSMVNEKGVVAEELNEVMDTDFLSHQIKNNAFDLKRVVGYAGEKMLQLCAPVRDKEIRAIIQERDMTAILFKMLEVLEAMKLDLANFRLQSIKPQLKKQAVDYERQKFDHALRIGAASLVKTEAWLVKSTTVLQKIADERNPEHLDHPDLKLKYGNVFNHALLDLLFSTTPINPATLPETFSMDGKRLFEMQNELQAMTIVAALTMLSKNIVTELRTNTEAMKELAASLFGMLKADNTTVATLSQEIIGAANMVFHRHTKTISELSKLTSRPTEQSFKQVTPEQEELITSMVEKTLSYKDPFFSVLNRRMERIVRTALEREYKPDSLKKNGLELLEVEFEPLVKKISALAQHNRDVYGQHYDSILKKHVA